MCARARVYARAYVCSYASRVIKIVCGIKSDCISECYVPRDEIFNTQKVWLSRTVFCTYVGHEIDISFCMCVCVCVCDVRNDPLKHFEKKIQMWFLCTWSLRIVYIIDRNYVKYRKRVRHADNPRLNNYRSVTEISFVVDFKTLAVVFIIFLAAEYCGFSEIDHKVKVNLWPVTKSCNLSFPRLQDDFRILKSHLGWSRRILWSSISVLM